MNGEVKLSGVYMEMYSSGRRGAPAKRLDGVEPCEGSNPSISVNNLEKGYFVPYANGRAASI